jgi:hypothetical protein
MICKFNRGYIYGLKCNKSNEIYIGSSTQPFSKRRHQHIADFKGWWSHFYGDGSLKYRNYRSSFPILFNNDYTFWIIKKYPCHNKAELTTEEERIRVDYLKKNFKVINSIKAKR